jgi:hypothetical protein
VPIKPENRALYPANWPAVSVEAKERARWACQHEGCTARHYAVGYWKKDGTWIELAPPPDNEPVFVGRWGALKQRAAEIQWSRAGDDPETDVKVVVCVLTTAHLDHDPTNCTPGNLRVWCQWHHLYYDRDKHAESAYMTRMAKRGNLDLPL